MQDRYAGDIGDYGKLGLLRLLSETGFSVGVNWYLNGDETQNKDGRHIEYLNNTAFSSCDPDLYTALKQIIGSGIRKVATLEKFDFLKDIVFFNERMTISSRTAWHGEAMKALNICDLVFLDPDNGLLIKSVSNSSPKSRKYVFAEEIAGYYLSGKTVVFYNHRSRQSEAVYVKRFEILKKLPELYGAVLMAVSFRRGTVRDYVFAVQPLHAVRISAAISDLVYGAWRGHFTKLESISFLS